MKRLWRAVGLLARLEAQQVLAETVVFGGTCWQGKVAILFLAEPEEAKAYESTLAIPMRLLLEPEGRYKSLVAAPARPPFLHCPALGCYPCGFRRL